MQRIDLCLCLGTSLAGMNADRIASTPAKKSYYDPEILGTIIINIQQTRLDKFSSVRIWGKLDDVFNVSKIYKIQFFKIFLINYFSYWPRS